MISWKVVKIPPIPKCPQTSNISIEREGELNTTESCILLSNLSSASHGVRLRPMKDGHYTPVQGEPSGQVETFPLLSPLMEMELFKESWTLPTLNTPGTETSCFWEENFQDLTTWCRNPLNSTQLNMPSQYQQPCVFPIGELTASKKSDVKDDRNITTTDEGGLKGLLEIGAEEWNANDNIPPSILWAEGPQQTQQQESSISDAWMSLASNPTQSVKTERIEPSTFEAQEVLNCKQDLITNTVGTWCSSSKKNTMHFCDSTTNSSSDSVNAYDSPAASLDSFVHQQECTKQNEDILHTLDQKSLDGFDLLSYVFDDGMNSMSKTASADAETLIAPATIPNTPPLMQNITKKTRSRRKTTERREKSKPYIIPAEVLAHSSKLPDRTKAAVKNNKRVRGKRNNSESDCDSQMSESSYRDTREKNNEASRKSRMNKKVKEEEMAKTATELEKDNMILKMKVGELEKLVTSLRTALLQSAIKKEP